MRNRVFVILVVVSLLAINSKAQQPNDDLRITGLTEISNFNNGTLTSYGVLVEYFLSKSFSINYQYSFGTNQFGNAYSHYPGTVSWAVDYSGYYTEGDMLSSGNLGDLIFIASFVIPEGISFHTYPRTWLEIAPFINPFSADYNILNNDHSTITASLGIRTHIKFTHHLSIVPHFGLKHIYTSNQNGILYGLGIGWLF